MIIIAWIADLLIELARIIWPAVLVAAMLFGLLTLTQEDAPPLVPAAHAAPTSAYEQRQTEALERIGRALERMAECRR